MKLGSSSRRNKIGSSVIPCLKNLCCTSNTFLASCYTDQLTFIGPIQHFAVCHFDQSGHRDGSTTSVCTPPLIEFGCLKHCSNINEQHGLGQDSYSLHPGNVLLHVEEPDSLGQIDKTLKEITGKSCRSLVDTLCQEYIHSGNYSRIWSILSKVEGLESQVRKLHWRNWDNSDDPTKDIFDRIHLISRALKELLMNAMEGVDMTQMYMKGVLLFQNYTLDAMY